MTAKQGRKIKGVLVGAGAILWIAVGVMMSLREPGNNAGKYRQTYDLLPYAGGGMMLITFSMAHLFWQYRSLSNRVSLLVSAINVIGGILFLAGGILVARNPAPFPFVLFSGYLVCMTGLILCGVVGYRKKLFSSTVSYNIIATGGALLFFNDQYTPWVACVLGGIALLLAYLLWARPRHFSTPSLRR
jgi:predicted neutral ceramidase superfamily lipid hydrolase